MEGTLAVNEGYLYWRHDKSDETAVDSRPTLVFIHAAVADHTVWDAQVKHFHSLGWNCLRYDMFGWGKSLPNGECKEPIDHIQHLHRLQLDRLGPDSKAIVIGLSMGGLLALDYTLSHPSNVAGIVSVAAGVGGFECDNKAEEDALFAHLEELMEAGDIRSAARLQVRIWADGPLQRQGRFGSVAGLDVANRMMSWNEDICYREHAKIGGKALPSKDLEPAAINRLDEVQGPAAVAFGSFDETWTTECMKHLAAKICENEASLKEFPTAHMIPLEQPAEFNRWLEICLKAHW